MDYNSTWMSVAVLIVLVCVIWYVWDQQKYYE